MTRSHRTKGSGDLDPRDSDSLRRFVPMLVTVAVVVVTLLSAAAFVPEGSHGFRRSGRAGEWSVLQPGLHFRIPLLQEFRVSADEVTVRDHLGTPDGATGAAYAVTARLSEEAISRGASRAMTPPEYVMANVEEILLGMTGGDPASVPGILREELGRRGFNGLIVQADGGSVAGLQRRRSLERPVVVIGLDGADWQVAEPLLKQGRLPHLAALRARGAWGHLRSSMPMLSPLLWTTAATGKSPDEHGIIDFLIPDPTNGGKVPITSGFRKVKALWNIFGDNGLYSSFVAWWATYPAEPVRGEIVSDRVAYSLFDIESPGAASSGLVYPPSLWDGIRGKIVDGAAIGDDLIESLAAVDAPAIATARRALAKGGVGTSRDRLVHLMKIIGSTETYHAIAMDRIAAGQPDLLGIYYQGIDEVSHRFAHCAPPALALCSPEEARAFGSTVDSFYEYQDRLLGEILAAVEPDSYVLLMSDHGFRNGGDRPKEIVPDIDGKPAKWHRLYGITVIAGPGIEPHRLDSVTLADIAPTVLRLAGLPGAGDMSGRALVAPPGSPEPPARIASYEGRGTRLTVASSEGVAVGGDAGREQMLENLRSLGYIGGEEEVRGETPSTVTAHTNVGALHIQKGQVAEAEREFRAALKIAPRYTPALMGLAEVRVRQGSLDQAFDLYGKAMTAGPDPEPGIFTRYAGLATRIDDSGKAARVLEGLRRAHPEVAEISVALAVLSEAAGDPDRTEALLNQALALDPESADAMGRLFRIRRRTLTETTLEPAIRRALGMNPGSVLHRNWLGLILERRGDAAGAEAQFKEALSIAPDFGGTMANLGSLYGRQGRLEEAVEILKRALRIEPRNIECRVNLGASLGKLGRTDEALSILQEGHEMAQESPEILNALAVTWAQKGNTSQAGALFRESLRIRENQPRVRAMLQEIEPGS